jgi:hypothetical protein
MNTNALLIDLLVPLVKRLVGAALFEFIQSAVIKVDNSHAAGFEKRANVIFSVKNLESYKQVSQWLVNLAVEVAVAKIRVKQ